MHRRKGISAASLVAMAMVLTLAGCLQDKIDANNRQLQEQQAQLDDLKQQVIALQNQPASYHNAPLQPGACDKDVMATATHKGGERMAEGDTTKALGFYQDAVTACPASAEAQLNLANTYESTGSRAKAMEHYRIAASATGPDADPAAVSKAREALNQLGASS